MNKVFWNIGDMTCLWFPVAIREGHHPPLVWEESRGEWDHFTDMKDRDEMLSWCNCSLAAMINIFLIYWRTDTYLRAQMFLQTSAFELMSTTKHLSHWEDLQWITDSCIQRFNKDVLRDNWNTTSVYLCVHEGNRSSHLSSSPHVQAGSCFFPCFCSLITNTCVCSDRKFGQS